LDRDIDKLVAEKVLGWIKPPVTSVLKPMWVAPPIGTIHPDLPKFSTNIEGAWLVVEKLRESKLFHLHDTLDGDNKKKYCAIFQYNDSCHSVIYEAVADNPSLAICKAALKTVGVEI